MKFCQTDLSGPEQYHFLSGNAVIYTHRSPDKETDNEDCLALVPHKEHDGVMLVADGLGGLPSGSSASQIALQAIERAVSHCGEPANLREAILDGYEKANQAIIDKGTGSATTLAVVELQHDEIRPYHVGDSKIIVCGQRGRIKLNTVSHSPVDYAVEAGMLDENEAVHHEERHLVSNVVGASDMSISIGSMLKLARYDTLLIASDGLFDNFYLEEIIEIIRKGKLELAARRLIDLANERMLSEQKDIPAHADDLSFILFRLEA